MPAPLPLPALTVVALPDESLPLPTPDDDAEGPPVAAVAATIALEIALGDGTLLPCIPGTPSAGLDLPLPAGLLLPPSTLVLFSLIFSNNKFAALPDFWIGTGVITPSPPIPISFINTPDGDVTAAALDAPLPLVIEDAEEGDEAADAPHPNPTPPDPLNKLENGGLVPIIAKSPALELVLNPPPCKGSPPKLYDPPGPAMNDPNNRGESVPSAAPFEAETVESGDAVVAAGYIGAIEITPPPTLGLGVPTCSTSSSMESSSCPLPPPPPRSNIFFFCCFFFSSS